MSARFDAFISYSHDDAEIAQRLAKRMSRYRVPKGCGVPRRPLRVFRDVERLTTHPNLGEALPDRIVASDHLVLLASQASAQSPYVDKEADTFLQERDAGDIVIALAAGDQSVPLPPSVRAAMDEPLYADLRKRPGFLAHRKQFRAESLRVIASVLGVDYDTLYQRDARRRRRVAVTASLASLLLVLITAASWMISGVSAERWVQLPVPRENSDSDLVVVRNLAVNRADPGDILFLAQDKRNYVNELEVGQIRASDGDAAADEHRDSFNEAWDAAWAEWHVLRADRDSGGFVEDGHGEERWYQVTAPDNLQWAWYQPPDRTVVRDRPAGYREQDSIEPALRAILTERVPEPAEWWDLSREIVIVSRATADGGFAIVTVCDIFTRQMGVTQTSTHHFLKTPSGDEWREITLAPAPDGTTAEDIHGLNDGRIVLATDRAGLFMAQSPDSSFREFNLAVRELSVSPAPRLIAARKPPALFVLAPPQVTGEHTSTGTLWRYSHDGPWKRLLRTSNTGP